MLYYPKGRYAMKLRTILAVLIMLAVFVPSVVMAEVTEEWVSIHEKIGYANDVAIAPSGIIYTAGTSNQWEGYGLVAYSQDGTQLWDKSYGSGWPECMDVEIGSTGDVYATCNRYHKGFLVKYTSDGTELWSLDFNTRIDDRYMGLDQNDNAYVTTRTTGYNGILTTKIDKDGNILWTAEYAEDRASLRTMTVDAAGNSYVSGHTNIPYAIHNLFTIKYDTNGNEEWVRTYVDGSNNTSPHDVALDATGNIYVTGNSARDFVTIKYDTNGNVLWTQTMADTRTAWEDNLAVDAAGNVHVLVFNYSQYDYITVKYDTNGNELWASTYDSGSYDEITAITVDTAGNVYSTGYGGNDDLHTVKYDADGNEQWVAIYDDRDSWDWSATLKADDSGNVYVVGGSWGDYPYNSATFTIKYSDGPSTITDIIDIINSSITNPGIANALTQLLTNAQASIDNANTVGAENMLEAAINLIEAQSGNKIDPTTATELIDYLNAIISTL